jgi:hypothetical protein
VPALFQLPVRDNGAHGLHHMQASMHQEIEDRKSAKLISVLFLC